MEPESILVDADDSESSWLEKKLTNLTLSWFLSGLSVILLLVAWNRGIALLYGLVALIAATLIVAWIAPRLNLFAVTASRSLPKTAMEGSKVKVILELKSSGWLSRYLIEIWDCLPFTTKADQQLISFAPFLSKNLSIPLSIQCGLRGVHNLGPLVLKTGFPLGINHSLLEVPNSKGSILVYPQPLKVLHYDVGNYRSSHANDACVLQRSKGHDEFAGVREYRHGDSMRHIHWHSSARRNELIVKEYHPVTTTQMSVLLDLKAGTNIGSGKHTTLEYAVKIAVSLGDYAIREGIPFSLSGNNQQLLSEQLYKHKSQRQDLLRTLAYVKADSDMNYLELIRQFVSQHKTAGSVILFDNGQADLQGGLNLLLSKHFHPIIYRFDLATFERQRFHSAFVRTVENHVPVFTLQCGTDLSRLFQ